MLNRESRESQYIVLQDYLPWRKRNELDIQRRSIPGKNHVKNEPGHAVKGGVATVDMQTIQVFPARQCGGQTAQTQDMVQITVRKEDAVQSLEN